MEEKDTGDTRTDHTRPSQREKTQTPRSESTTGLRTSPSGIPTQVRDDRREGTHEGGQLLHQGIERTHNEVRHLGLRAAAEPADRRKQRTSAPREQKAGCDRSIGHQQHPQTPTSPTTIFQVQRSYPLALRPKTVH